MNKVIVTNYRCGSSTRAVKEAARLGVKLRPPEHAGEIFHPLEPFKHAVRVELMRMEGGVAKVFPDQWERTRVPHALDRLLAGADEVELLYRDDFAAQIKSFAIRLQLDNWKQNGFKDNPWTGEEGKTLEMHVNLRPGAYRMAEAMLTRNWRKIRDLLHSGKIDGADIIALEDLPQRPYNTRFTVDHEPEPKFRSVASFLRL